MTRIATLALALVLAAGLVRSAAAEIADSDRTGIQSIIGSQIEAFRRDDAAAAYDFASPMIQTLFPTPEVFMEMVQTGYMPVYRPQSFTFGPLVETPRGPVQRVFITGPDETGGEHKGECQGGDSDHGLGPSCHHITANAADGFHTDA